MTNSSFKRPWTSLGASSLYNVDVISNLDVNLYYHLYAWDAEKIPPERGVGGLAERGHCKTFPVHPRCMVGFTRSVQQHPHHLIQVTIMCLSNDRFAPLSTKDIPLQI